MIASPAMLHAAGNAREIIMIAAVAMVIFWKEMIRVLLAICAVALVAGAFEFLHSMYG